MNALSAAGLADLAGVTQAEVERLADLGVLVARDGAGPFLESDVQKVRLAAACEQAGLPMEGIAAAIRAGQLSFAFLEAAPYRRWAVRSGLTYRQVSQETGVPLELLGGTLEAAGFARMTPDEPIREDELEIVPLLQLGLATGILDQLWSTRLGRGFAEGMRLIAKVENDVWQARFIAPVLASGAGQQTARELASQLSGELNFASLVDRALMAAYRRQQELAWIEQLVEEIEAALEETGVLGRLGRVPAMCFLDLVGYTRLTEEQGDQVAAELAERLGVLVDRSSRARRGAGEVAGRWGDGPLPRSRRGGAGGAGDGGAVPGGWAASRPCRGRGRAGGGTGRRLLRPHRESGRSDRRLCQRRSGPGERARGPGGAAPGGDLRRAGAGAACRHRPSSAAAGSPPG